MNLHSIAGPMVSAVNPSLPGRYYRSTGNTTRPDYSRTPVYDGPWPVRIQMQPLSYRDLIQIDGLNQNGEKRSMHLSGDWKGVSRADQRGGDKVQLPNGSWWLVVLVLEDFFPTSGWVRVAVVKQVDGA